MPSQRCTVPVFSLTDVSLAPPPADLFNAVGVNSSIGKVIFDPVSLMVRFSGVKLSIGDGCFIESADGGEHYTIVSIEADPIWSGVWVAQLKA